MSGVDRPLDRSWPIRTDGWEERLIERARALFSELAERHGLKLQWGDDAPVEVCCTFPQQDGLDFPISMTLQNADELTLDHELFWVNVFPADRESSWSDFERFADGLISGEARALVRHCGNPKRYYVTEAQIMEDGQWRSISSGIAPWRWRPWGRRTEVIRNTARPNKR